MELKVGDKVKFVQCTTLNPKLWGQVCVICEVRDSRRDFPYLVKWGITGRLPVLDGEIEKLVIAGQLLFPFMEQL